MVGWGWGQTALGWSWFQLITLYFKLWEEKGEPVRASRMELERFKMVMQGEAGKNPTPEAVDTPLTQQFSVLPTPWIPRWSLSDPSSTLCRLSLGGGGRVLTQQRVLACPPA